MKPDIQLIIEKIQLSFPNIQVNQLKVKYSSDDDGLWFFRTDKSGVEVQAESSSGACPFLIETTDSNIRHTASTVPEAIEIILKLLHLN